MSLNHVEALRREELALDFLDAGAFLTRDSDSPLVVTRPSGEKGVLIKAHEANPDLPLSTFYFNLRTYAHPKPGPLTKVLVRKSAQCMYALVKERNLVYERHAGVPNAGDPFAEEYENLSGSWRILMRKETGESKRHIAGFIGAAPPPGTPVLLLDDLITKAGSKLEAIQVLRDADLEVKDVVVLIDREQGGEAGLKKVGCRLHAVFGFRALLDIYRHRGAVNEEFYNDTLAYLAA